MKQYTKSFGPFVVALLSVVMLTGSTAIGAPKTWVPTTGGAWTTAANWSPSGVPSAGDDVTISSDQSAQITAVPAISLASLSVNGNASLVAAVSGNTLTVTGTFIVAPGKTLLLGDDTAGRMEFTLAATATGTVSGTVTLYSQGTARVFTNNGDLAITSAGLINGAGSNFVLVANAILRIGSTDGITTVGTAAGNIQTTGARTFDADADYVYSGTANQNVGTGLPTNLTGTLTVNNASGITINSDQTVNGTLTLTSGNVTTGAHALIIGPAGTVSRTSGHVVGNLRLNFATGNVAATTFHIGTSTAYTPATVDIDGTGGTAGTITASTTGTAHGDLANSGVDAAKDVERFWTLAPGTAALGGRTYKLKTEFLPGDVPGGANTSAFVFSRKDGSSGVWSEPTGGAYTRTGTSTEYSNFTSFSDFVVGEPKTARSIYYVSTTGNDVTGDGSLALPFKTIGKGVSTALSKDTVVVLEGTYTEAVNITKSLALLGWGPGLKTIEAPAGFEATTPTAYDYTLGGFVKERALVHIGTTTPINVLMRGFTVDVKTLGPPHAAAIAYGGILAEKCTVTVAQNIVKNVLPADGVSIRDPGLLYNGRGIEVRGSGSVAVIDSNTLQEINRFHILLNATDTTDLPPAVYPQAYVRHNSVTGKGSTYAAGQKGVWFSHGAYGTISHNVISNLDYPSPAIEPERATAIVIWREDFNLTGVTSVLENTLTASTFTNNKGIYVWGVRDTVRGNVITGFRWGIELHNERNASVTRNAITGGAVGIMLGDERIVAFQNARITIGGSLGDKNVITGQISPATGGRAITLAFRDPLNTEELKSPYPVIATYNDFGVYTASEISDRIFDRADTTLADIDTVLFTPFMVPKLSLALKAFLQGPFTTVGDSMRNSLKTAGYLAAHFAGATIPSLAVDSVNIQVRDSLTTAKSLKVYSVPAWLLTDGTLRAFADTTKRYIEFPDSISGDYYVVLRHRNHLGIMSSMRVAGEGSTTPTSYDFTTGLARAYGADAMKALGTGGIAPYGLYGGDADGDGQVVSSDFNVFNPRFVTGSTGYQASDWNLDGQVTSTDFNLFNANFTAGKVTRVP